MKKQNEQIELMVELVEGLLEEEGYKTLRFSKTKNLSTTGYDCLVLQDAEGKEFTITFNESFVYNDKLGKWQRTNIVGEAKED